MSYIRALAGEQLAHALERGGQLADAARQGIRPAAGSGARAAHGSCPSVASSFSAMRAASTW